MPIFMDDPVVIALSGNTTLTSVVARLLIFGGPGFAARVVGHRTPIIWVSQLISGPLSLPGGVLQSRKAQIGLLPIIV